MPRRCLVQIAYDGSAFAGAALVPGQRTVSSALQEAIGRVGLDPQEIEACSRTDRGVHARANVFRVVLDQDRDCDWLLRALDRHLPDDARPRGVAEDLGQTVRSKRYVYRLDRSPGGEPLRVRTHWRSPGLPDPVTLDRLAGLLVGTHNFEAFRRQGETRRDFVRTITVALWEHDPDESRFIIAGSGFWYRGVRSLVGAMLAVARGNADEERFLACLGGETGPLAQQQAPARGLELQEIVFEPDPDWVRPR